MQEVEERVRGEYDQKRSEAESLLNKLQHEADTHRQYLAGLTQNSANRAYYDDQLKQMFPDYDQEKSDDDDVTDTVRAEFAQRLGSIKTIVNKEYLIKLVDSVKNCSKATMTKSDIDGIVGVVEWVAPIIGSGEMYDLVKRKISNSPKVHPAELRSYLEKLLVNDPEPQKSS